MGKGAEKAKGEPEEVQTQKGATAKERAPKEKMIQKEKKPMGIPEEERRCQKWKKRNAILQRVDILRRQREKRTGGHRIDERRTCNISGRVGRLGLCHGAWKLGGNPKTDETSAISGETRNLGFGEYADWAYAEVLMRKQGYVQFMLGGTEVLLEGEKRSIDRIRYKEAGIAMDFNTGAAGREAKNIPTAGGGFGFLIIPRDIKG